MNGRCPSCGAEIAASDYAELLRCPRCRDRFHPEALRASRRDETMRAVPTDREKLLALADEMERAADLDERDLDRPVTRFDARRWAEAVRDLASRSLRDKH